MMKTMMGRYIKMMVRVGKMKTKLMKRQMRTFVILGYDKESDKIRIDEKRRRQILTIIQGRRRRGLRIGRVMAEMKESMGMNSRKR